MMIAGADSPRAAFMPTTTRATALAAIITTSVGYILLRPVSNNQVLIPVFLVLVAASAIHAHSQAGRLAGELRPIFVILLLLGLYGTVLGLVGGNPGWTTGLLAYVVGPLLWWIWATAGTGRLVSATFSVITVCTIITGSVISLYSLAQQGFLPQIIPETVLNAQGAGFGEADGLTELRYYGLSTLAATGPICAAMAVMPPHPLLANRRLALLGATVASLASIQAGRRGQIVVTLLVFLLIPAAQRVLGTKAATTQARTSARPRPSAVVIAAWLAITATFLALMFGFTPPRSIGSAVSSTLAFASRSSESADSVRIVQSDALTEKWLERPVLGHGFGATIDGLVRSEDRPWNFELQYHELLFQTGIVGFLLVSAVAIIGVRVLRAATAACSELATPTLVASIGALSMLIVNATNPYLKAPGHLWAVFFPLMIANVALTSTDTSDRMGQRCHARDQGR